MTPKRKVTQIAVVNLIHSRLTPTRPFSKRSPTQSDVFFCFNIFSNRKERLF
ncbi:MAG: hypothetical protein LBK82_03050 [Planctomycetaceae bacterium]|nr:hypothetical protein [Planctomycetaceae bacterium]